jgi:peptidoglycan hydrolase-like protein with peptidoglycan-binding domain
LVDTRSENGTLGYGNTTSVIGRLTGTVTALPDTGATVLRGQALYRVDNVPVVLLYGTLPSYRELAPGVEGVDVKQFEQNLWDLGYRGFTVDRKYSGATATAVRKWQHDLGLVQTGKVELGRVVYAAAAIRVGTLKAAVGDVLLPGSALFTCTGLARVATVKLELSDRRLAVPGATVTVSTPDGQTVAGKIGDVRTVIETGEGDGNSDPTTKIRVTVAIDDQQALARLDEAALKVTFTASQRENVLTVPVAALLALPEGGCGVQVVEGTATRIVPVQTGLFGAGRVEVSGGGITDGMVVGMPS